MLSPIFPIHCALSNFLSRFLPDLLTRSAKLTFGPLIQCFAAPGAQIELAKITFQASEKFLPSRSMSSVHLRERSVRRVN